MNFAESFRQNFIEEDRWRYLTDGLKTTLIITFFAVIIGTTGKNFAAGMSGGVAYVLDEYNSLYRNLNKEMVLMEKVEHKTDKEMLKNLLENHVQYTGSVKAKAILDDFENYLGKFKKIIPADYKKIMSYTEQFIEEGMSPEEAQIEAFNKCVS